LGERRLSPKQQSWVTQSNIPGTVQQECAPGNPGDRFLALLARSLERGVVDLGVGAPALRQDRVLRGHRPPLGEQKRGAHATQTRRESRARAHVFGPYGFYVAPPKVVSSTSLAMENIEIMLRQPPIAPKASAVFAFQLAGLQRKWAKVAVHFHRVHLRWRILNIAHHCINVIFVARPVPNRCSPQSPTLMLLANQETVHRFPLSFRLLCGVLNRAHHTSATSRRRASRRGEGSGSGRRRRGLWEGAGGGVSEAGKQGSKRRRKHWRMIIQTPQCPTSPSRAHRVQCGQKPWSPDFGVYVEKSTSSYSATVSNFSP